VIEVLKITKSKVRRELLRLYFTNPEKEYYLRELERTLGFPVGNIRRELLKLEKGGLFEKRLQGNLTYYSLNKKYPLFKELKSIVFKTVGVAGSLKEALEKIKNIEVALIYGSYAMGKEKVNSDIDLLMIGKIDEDRLIEVISKLEKRLQREISYTIYDSKDFNKKKKEKNSFILDVIKRPKIFLIGSRDAL